MFKSLPIGPMKPKEPEWSDGKDIYRNAREGYVSFGTIYPRGVDSDTQADAGAYRSLLTTAGGTGGARGVGRAGPSAAGRRDDGRRADPSFH